MIKYEFEWGGVYNIDCFEFMKNYNGKFKSLITDPPYLISYKTNHILNKTHRFTKEIMNDKEFDFNRFFALAYDLLENNTPIYIFCGYQTLDYFLNTIKRYFKVVSLLVWVKNNWTAGDLKGSYANRTEYIIYATKGRVLLKGRRDNNVLFFDRVKSSVQVHQNEKPLPLIEFLLTKHDLENVFDPFAGSATIGQVCLKNGIKYIGCEIDKYYFDIACKKLSNKNLI